MSGRGVRLLVLTMGLTAPAFGDPSQRVLDLAHLSVVPGTSGNVNYYRVIDEAHGGPYLHADYQPGMDTTMPGITLPDGEDHAWRHLRWRWRAVTLPLGGNECDSEKGDSAASVYLAWRRGLRWYVLKYSWSTVAPRGTVCDHKSNPFRAAETMILESGGPVNTWVSESLDLDAEWRKHFAEGDPKAEVPNFIGVAILTDGDQTRSPSSADYADFVLSAK